MREGRAAAVTAGNNEAMKEGEAAAVTTENNEAMKGVLAL